MQSQCQRWRVWLLSHHCYSQPPPPMPGKTEEENQAPSQAVPQLFLPKTAGTRIPRSRVQIFCGPQAYTAQAFPWGPSVVPPTVCIKPTCKGPICQFWSLSTTGNVLLYSLESPSLTQERVALEPCPSFHQSCAVLDADSFSSENVSVI